MCGFLVTNVPNIDANHASRFQSRRGPDHTTVVEIGHITWLHHLLSISGDFAPQPFLGDGTACVYNGEIYNSREFGEYASDGMCLLPAYEKIGPRFVRELDGEFAIAIVDQRNNSLFLSTDI